MLTLSESLRIFRNTPRAVRWTKEIETRAEELTDLGFKPMDALHLASAEMAEVAVLLTCDDQFLRAGQRNAGRVNVRICNPVDFVREVKDEN